MKPRANLIVRLPVYDRNTQKLIGQAVNASASGLQINGDKPLPLERVLPISLVIPTAAGGRERVALEIQAMWCAQDKPNRIYMIGSKFLNITPEVLFKLQRLIDPNQPFG